MDVVNIHEAKTNLSKLIRRIEAGETIALARRGEVVAELRPASAVRKQNGKRMLGWAAKYGWKVPDDFDTMLDDDIEEWNAKWEKEAEEGR